MAFKAAVIGILSIPALAISYYFAVALPRNERAKLEFEKEKYEAQQALESDRIRKAEEEISAKRDGLYSCLAGAESDYQSALKSNGTKTPRGYAVPLDLQNNIQRKRDTDLAECHRQFDR